jgi:hypothetical protein
MDGLQVSFGRRGIVAKQPSPAQAGFGHAHHDVDRHACSREIVPDVVVERSVAKQLMYVAGVWLVIFLTAGSTKHSNDLPFWMRPDADFHLRNYLFPFAFCALATLVTLGPVLRRPVALKLFDDYFEFVPLVGASRIVKWSDVGEISLSRWDEYKRIYIDVSGGKRITITTYHLTRSRDEIASLIEYSRSHAGFRGLRLSGEPLDGHYMFPGH